MPGAGCSTRSGQGEGGSGNAVKKNPASAGLAIWSSQGLWRVFAGLRYRVTKETRLVARVKSAPRSRTLSPLDRGESAVMLFMDLVRRACMFIPFFSLIFEPESVEPESGALWSRCVAVCGSQQHK